MMARKIPELNIPKGAFTHQCIIAPIQTIISKIGIPLQVHNVRGEKLELPYFPPSQMCRTFMGTDVFQTDIQIERKSLKLQLVNIVSMAEEVVKSFGSSMVIESIMMYVEDKIRSGKIFKDMIVTPLTTHKEAILGIGSLNCYLNPVFCKYMIDISIALGIPRMEISKRACKGCPKRLRCELVEEDECSLYRLFQAVRRENEI